VFFHSQHRRLRLVVHPFCLLTVEILVYDSSHEFSNRNTLFLRNLFQRRFLVSKDRCSFESSFA